MARRVTWTQYRESIGDRSGLFGAIADTWPIRRALYPGSYVDLSPSTAIPSVTYVDTDVRAARYFADPARARAELAGRTPPSAGTRVDFLAADYTRPLDVPDASMDLVISLFAGPVWDHCRRYLRPGGWLLANASHGDASLAALDPTLRLVAVAHHRDDRYRVITNRLTDYLIPKRPETADPDRIRRSGRGIAYTRPAFAYLFETT
ncbi:MAG: class I SAM-dependent methyltransferase [Propionibacteriaceae bacterium]|nr:class I SAM-dependent methyltransferase [Propionibacteriaceae bacterium]